MLEESKSVAGTKTNEPTMANPPPSIAPPPIAVVRSPKPPSFRFAQGLSSTGIDDCKIVIEYKQMEQVNKETLEKGTYKGMSVIFSGQWDGRMLKGAIRAIERAYAAVKHGIMREAASRRAKEAKS